MQPRGPDNTPQKLRQKGPNDPPVTELRSPRAAQVLVRGPCIYKSRRSLERNTRKWFPWLRGGRAMQATHPLCISVLQLCEWCTCPWGCHKIPPAEAARVPASPAQDRSGPGQAGAGL